MPISIEAILLLSSSLICVLLPIVWIICTGTRQNAYTLAQPIWLLTISVFFGTTFKIWYLLLLRQVNYSTIFIPSINDHVLYGADITSLLPGLLAVLIGVSSYLFGYGINKKSSLSFPTTDNNLNSRLIYLFSIFFIFISVISFFLLVNYSTDDGGFGLKKFNQLEGGSVNRLFHLEYYYYKFATLIRYSFYLLFIYFITAKKLKKETLFLCLVVYSLGAFMTCYMGNRAHVVILMLDLIFFTAIIYITKDVKQYRNKILITMVCSLLVISVVLIFTTSQIRYKNIDFLKKSSVFSKTSERMGDSRINPDSQLGRAIIDFEQRDVFNHVFPNINESEEGALSDSDRGELGEAIVSLDQSNVLTPQQVMLICEYIALQKEYRFEDLSESYWGTRSGQLLSLDTGEKSLVTEYFLQLFGNDKKNDNCLVELSNNQRELAEIKESTILSTKQMAFFEKILRGRYFVDILKTSRVINHTPSKVQYLYGETLYGWLFAIVPRSVWPDKPIFMEISPLLSTMLFYEPNNNIPPGFVAELFLNFGWIGIIFGMFTLGFLLRYFYNSVVLNKITPIIALIYAMIVVRFSIILFNTSFGDAALKSGLDLFPILLLYLYQVYRHRAKKLE